MATTASSAGGRALLRRLGQRLVDNSSSAVTASGSRRGRNGVAVLSRQLQVRFGFFLNRNRAGDDVCD